MAEILKWLEIPAKNFHKTVRFYEQVLSTRLEINNEIEQLIAVFNVREHGFRGCISHDPEHQGGNGIKPMFYVSSLYSAIQKVEEMGGKIIRVPEKLKQVNKKGEEVAGNNLIDNKIGYLAEVQDNEGNRIFLYSHD